MEKAVVLNLPAYNEVEIISMVFKDFKSGVEYVKGVLGRDPDKLEDGCATWDADEFFNGKPDYDKIKKIVKGYYGGCGEAYRIEVKEVDYATPLCEFDFD